MAPPDDVPTGSAARPWHAARSPFPAAAAHPEVRGTPAGLVTRVLAGAVDLLVVVVLVAAGYAAVTAIRFLVHPARFSFPATGGRTLLLVGLGVLAVYLALTWAVLGGSVGDRLMALRVVGPGGTPLHWGQCVLRAALCTVFPIGLFWVLVSRTNRSVQDVLVRTAVVYDG